jgi:tripartite-type tricarboxylate transporter receptor subunit TctC
MREMGTTSVGSTRAEFAAFVKEEIDRWAEVVRVSGAKVE